MVERRPSGATHSFRLQPRAATIMDEHPAIRPNSKYHNKSAWASQAIMWFFDSPLLQRERDPNTGDYTGKYIVSAQGQPQPIALVLRIQELEKELEEARLNCSPEQIDETGPDRTPRGWVSRVIKAVKRLFHI
jgi:hypothetical protein